MAITMPIIFIFIGCFDDSRSFCMVPCGVYIAHKVNTQREVSMEDRNGSAYFEVGNLRITCLAKSWDGNPGIRIQSYREGGGLHRGAEIPIPDRKSAFELLEAVSQALNKLAGLDRSEILDQNSM